MQIVVFTLNDELCGVDTCQVNEIVKYEGLTKMPKMPKFIDGIINLRDRVVPVVNLNKRFNLGETEITKKTKIIITEIEKKYIGFIVNNVTEILKLPPEKIESTPDIIQKSYNRYLEYVGKKDEKLISILDLSSILTDKELDKIDDE
ncbi:chemotaxis protein CheW [Herbivorax sp. ANBcel31]|uniref:chemotaxis protein CheW n=1 Tax=Herbivorax sp. ANBcel31 TaxID=3069754 RepID=UPI0027B460A0|nr:chemotaxis protein CheW [Herbivorax sp. ANBcel31]MDQ2085278.1 chemotaxis protein CheW [Herbivorax sp. ANBcel31]